MEIVKNCLDRHLKSTEEDYDRDFLLWEGNYWDEPVHDCCQLSLTTVHVLVDKIAIVLKKYCQEDEAVLLFLPQVIQLPLSILAAFRAGITVIPLDPGVTDDERLRNVLLKGQPSLVVTVDAYWLGQTLQEAYKRLNAVLSEQTSVRHTLVIRHTAPNPGVPPPEELIPARRPFYGIEWSIKEERDVEWSEEIRQVKIEGLDVQGTEKETKAIVLLPSKDGSELRALYQVDMTTKIEKNFVSGPVFSLIHPENVTGLLSFLSVWSNGLPLVQFEGLIDYPDSARIAHIVRKYQVISLILPEAEIDPEYLGFVDCSSLETVLVSTEGQEGAAGIAFPGAKIAKFMSCLE